MIHYPSAGQAPSAPALSVQARTSKSAILSLVSGIVSLVCCCIPVFGLVSGLGGIGLGIMGMLRSSRADGSVSGRGIAIAGTVTGILGTIAGLVILIGGLIAFKQFDVMGQQIGAAYAQAEKGDFAPLRAAVIPSQGPLSDAQIQDFLTASQAKLGAFRSVQGSVLDSAQLTMQLFQANPDLVQRLQQRGSPLMVPAQFDNARAGLLLLIPSSSSVPTPENIGIFQPGSTDIIWLVPLDPLPPPPTPVVPQTAPSNPSTPTNPDPTSPSSPTQDPPVPDAPVPQNPPGVP